MPVLANAELLLELRRSDGAITRAANMARGLELVTGPPAPPWRIRLEDGSTLTQPARFQVEHGKDEMRLAWTSERGDLISATVRSAGGDLRFRCALTPADGPRPAVLEYPVIGGIGALTGRDCLLHSYATGFLFHDPATLFRNDGDGPARGLMHAPYPEGFSGSTLQLMAYYADELGGFSFATDDDSGAQKWFDFFREGDHLRAAIGHGSADLERLLEPDYDVILSALLDGTWTEVADRYKEWAVEQRWCSRGLVADRSKQERRLHEEVGLVTFGINAAHDRSRWLRAISSLAGTPTMHILGPNWTNTPQDYRNAIPGDIDEWLPARFHPANVDAIREQGDLLVPFLFNLLCGAETDARQQIPQPTLSFDAYAFPFLCPATAFLQRLHRERDSALVEEYGVDGVYYDISANNATAQCHDTGHGHPRGGGVFMVDAYRELFSAPQVPRGTELVNEVYLDRLDFYQARAEASPMSSFEADKFRDWLKAGRVEKIPLFAYVYHEYGPVRMDGWAKLSREQGDLFYWIGARVLAWGGLFELNYEFSPLENLDDEAEPLDEHYADLPDRRFPIDPEKAAFVGELAQARVGPANRYLAFGSMLPPLQIESPATELEWHHYNCPQHWPAFDDHGTYTVDAVVHCAWRHGREAAVVLINVDRVPHRIRVPLSPAALRLDPDHPYSVELVLGNEHRSIGSLEGGVDLELPPRRVALLEITLQPLFNSTPIT